MGEEVLQEERRARWTLRQQDAERLIEELKNTVEREVAMPAPGEQNRQFHVQADSGEDFTIALFQGKRNLERHMISARITRSNIQLMRLCVNGTPHPNPDGSRPGRTHLHIYREGYDDRVAHPIDIESPDFVNDTILLLDKFHVIRKPHFQEGMEGMI